MAALLPERRRYLGTSDIPINQNNHEKRLKIHAYFDRLSWPCDNFTEYTIPLRVTRNILNFTSLINLLVSPFLMVTV